MTTSTDDASAEKPASGLFAQIGFYQKFVRVVLFFWVALLLMLCFFPIPLILCGEGGKVSRPTLNLYSAIAILCVSLIASPILLKFRSFWHFTLSSLLWLAVLFSVIRVAFF